MPSSGTIDLFDASTHRTLVIGNSGSGKSWLAARIAARDGVEPVNLDDIYWIDPLALKKRGAADAKAMAAVAAEGERWVIEGVYGWLIDVAVRRATTLIWLDLPWADCKAGLLARGASGVSPDEFDNLLAWAEQYWTRQSPSSHAGHAAIFAAFPGTKITLASRREVAAFAIALSAAA